MPNPLIAGYSNRGIQPPERKWEPVPEQYAGDNRPYIGVIDHGVDSGEQEFNPDLDEDMNESGEAIYDVEVDEKPIPVRIVTGDTSVEVKDWRVYHTFATPVTSSIVQQHDSRTSIVIKNIGTVTAYLGNDFSNSNALNGYPLEAGGTFSVVSSRAVYATADSNVELVIVLEFSVSV